MSEVNTYYLNQRSLSYPTKWMNTSMYNEISTWLHIYVIKDGFITRPKYIIVQNISENIIVSKYNFIDERFRLFCINFTWRSLIASRRKFQWIRMQNVILPLTDIITHLRIIFLFSLRKIVENIGKRSIVCWKLYKNIQQENKLDYMKCNKFGK